MAIDAPRPGSHDRSTPTGSLEESAVALFEAMLAARDAEERGESGAQALGDFYRSLMTGTLLLPVPPEHGDEAKAALETAVNDDAEVEISVMGGAQAARVLSTVRGDLATDAERDAFEAPILAEYEHQGSPYYSTARLWDDGVIDPLDTRRVLAMGISAALNGPISESRFGVFRM